jgi:hypothetical protein
MSDSITILRCARGLRLAKLIRPDEIVTYDSTRIYDGWTVPISGLAEVEELISKIIHQPRIAVVRGQLLGGVSVHGIRRLLYPDPTTDDEPTLVDAPRQWLAADFEGVQRPPHIAATDLEACGRDALRHLPRAFRHAACLIQATAGHGLKPDHRLRLWFWLSRATGGAELKRWFKGCPADPSIFRPAQVIYTAAPIFEGCEDHLPRRLAALDGADVVAVPSPEALAPPARREAKPLPASDMPGASRYAWAALRNAAARVAGAPVNSRHPACVRESRSLARLVEARLLTSAQVIRAMGEALEHSGKTKAEGEAIAAWGLSHPAIRQLPEAVTNGRP